MDAGWVLHTSRAQGAGRRAARSSGALLTVRSRRLSNLAPKDAQVRLEQLLADAQASISTTEAQELLVSLRQAVEGWLAERQSEKGLKRSTVAGYDDMFERLYRDLGAYTPVRDICFAGLL